MKLTRQQIEIAAKMALDVVPGARVVVYGSQVEGTAGPDSDLDLLLVVPVAYRRSRLTACVRYRLSGLRLPIHVRFMRDRVFDSEANTPGSMPCEAAQDGRIFSRGVQT